MYFKDVEQEYRFNRNFMKAENDSIKSDQELNLPQPPLEKGNITDNIVKLDTDFLSVIKKNSIVDIIQNRKSVRSYSEKNLSFTELSFLLWATQGVKSIKGNNYATIRTVPSGGARHPFETYLIVDKVDNLKKGIYHYISISHSIEYIGQIEDFNNTVSEIMCDQKFAGRCAVVFLWSVVPYRAEWRYSTGAHKTILIDVGHVCQNLYIACEAIGCGTCAIASYEQAKSDKILNLDGDREFTIYAATVGKI